MSEHVLCGRLSFNMWWNRVMFLFVRLVWLHFGFTNIYSYTIDLMSKHSMLFMYHSLITVNQ